MCANSSFPTTFLPEWFPPSFYKDPPSPFPPLHDPALPGCRVDEDLVTSTESEIQQQALRNVSKPGGDQGGRETPEETILGTGGPLCPDLLREVGAPAPPHIPYPSSMHTHAHSQTLAPSLFPGRKETQTQEVRLHCLPPPAHREQQGGEESLSLEGQPLCLRPPSIGGLSQRSC